MGPTPIIAATTGCAENYFAPYTSTAPAARSTTFNPALRLKPSPLQSDVAGFLVDLDMCRDMNGGVPNNDEYVLTEHS